METRPIPKSTGQGTFKVTRGSRQAQKRGSKTLTTLIGRRNNFRLENEFADYIVLKAGGGLV